MKSIFFFLSCLDCLVVQAQQITILDDSTKEPLVGVAAYNSSKTKSTISNLEGQMQIDVFAKNEKIIIQHISHIEWRDGMGACRTRWRLLWRERASRRFKYAILMPSVWEVLSETGAMPSSVTIPKEELQSAARERSKNWAISWGVTKGRSPEA